MSVSEEATVEQPVGARPQPPSPMMAQYIEIKAANPDCLLFYRMGDFYELFFEDAALASQALGIALTRRGRHAGEDIPMCGVPVATADDYLARLIKAGFRVAVCEQLEPPEEARKRGHKAVVRRDVVRLVTPGTLTEDTLLDARRPNRLLALASAREGGGALRFGLATLDISTGEFRVGAVDALSLGAEIARLAPAEIILPDPLYDDADLKSLWAGSRAAMTPLPREAFDGASAERRVAAAFGVETTQAFGAFTRVELTAAAAAIAYVERTQVGGRPALSPPAREIAGAVLQIDGATRANLEILATMQGERRGGLLWAVDRTLTPAGGRLLAERLSSPLTSVVEIRGRLDAVAALEDPIRTAVRERLRGVPDMARALSRLSLGRGSPRDLGAVRGGLERAAEIGALLQGLAEPPAEIALLAGALGPLPDLALRLGAALADELPPAKSDGDFVRPGARADLDEARALRDGTRTVIAALQARYAEETGIRSLRIKHNAVLGYFIEVTATHADRLFAAAADGFHHRQTLAGAARFSTSELAELERRITGAAARALEIELQVFAELCAAAVEEAEVIRAAAGALAALDVTAGFAELAAELRYVRPQIEEDLRFRIERGRHPVVERALAEAHQGPFVANDCDLTPARPGDAGTLWLVTGPNMGGKSTYLRQNALIALLAQAGSFVPADRAEIGVVDRLFSRVGASDDLARGRSTFMVEMVETAAILNQATERSLVILDEIGRGTATYDGLSIAWGSLEHLHDVNRCRGLFATHYHELTALSASLPRLRNATLKVKEWDGEVIFLHEVVPGAADRSYGVAVARLAGLPRRVIERARTVLTQLEAGERGGVTAKLIDDLPLFRAAPPPPPPDELGAMLDAISPDDLTPREALDALYRLKAKRRESRGD